MGMGYTEGSVVIGLGTGFIASLIISGIFMYIIYNNYGTYETNKTEN